MPLPPPRAWKQEESGAGPGEKSTRETRRCVDLAAVAVFEDSSAVSVKVLDLSYNGCKIHSAVALLPGLRFSLSVLGLGKMPACVRWCRGEFAGLSFNAEPAEPARETAREHERILLSARVLLRRSGYKNYYVQALDVCSSGCRVEFVDRPCVGERHWLKFDGLEAIEAEVRWIHGLMAGLQFVRPIYPAVFEPLVARLSKSQS